MKTGIIVQARMGSTRLPGKILKNFYDDKTLLDIMLDKLHKIKGVKVIVATSDSASDDQLDSFLKSKGEIVFRGSENDVLSRFVQAARDNGIDDIVRICSDNPFIDVEGIDKLIESSKGSDADYIGFRINGKPSILTHFGFWGEFVRLSALEKVAQTTPAGTPAHEHVTYHIYNHPDEYKCEWVEAPRFLQGREDIRLTVDTPDDFANAQIVYADLMTINREFSLSDVVDYLDKHTSVKESMIFNIVHNRKK